MVFKNKIKYFFTHTDYLCKSIEMRPQSPHNSGTLIV